MFGTEVGTPPELQLFLFLDQVERAESVSVYNTRGSCKWQILTFVVAGTDSLNRCSSCQGVKNVSTWMLLGSSMSTVAFQGGEFRPPRSIITPSVPMQVLILYR